MPGLAKLTLVYFKLFVREPVPLFFTVLFPMLMLTMFGLIWGNEPSDFFGGHGYVDQTVPGLAAVIVGTVGLMSVPVATASAREQKILRRFQATPLRPFVYFAAQVIVYLLLSLAGMVLLILTAVLLFDLQFMGTWPAVLAAFLLCALAFVAIGYVVAGLAPTSRTAQAAGQIIFFPLIFLSDATIPLQMMPENIQQLARWLPTTQVVLLLQSLWFGHGWDLAALATTTAMLVAGALLANFTFRWE